MVAPPPHGAVEVGARPGDLAELATGHGQEEQVEGVGLAFAGREALLQGGDGLGVLAGAVLGDAQRVEVDRLVGRQPHGSRARSRARAGSRVARDGRQRPGQVVAERASRCRSAASGSCRRGRLAVGEGLVEPVQAGLRDEAAGSHRWASFGRIFSAAVKSAMASSNRFSPTSSAWPRS